MNDPKRLGAEIAEQRKRKNLTQANVGRQGTVSAIENGDNVNLYTWLAALDAVGLNVQLVPHVTAKPAMAVSRRTRKITEVSSRPGRTGIFEAESAGIKVLKAAPARVSVRVIDGKIKLARKKSSEEFFRLLAARQIKD
jgi:transcriptional regulator with XRE-family HTH domain